MKKLTPQRENLRRRRMASTTIKSMSAGAVLLLLVALLAVVSCAAAQGGGVRYDLRKPPKCTTKAQKKAFKQAAKAGAGEGTQCVSRCVCACMCVCPTYIDCTVNNNTARDPHASIQSIPSPPSHHIMCRIQGTHSFSKQRSQHNGKYLLLTFLTSPLLICAHNLSIRAFENNSVGSILSRLRFFLYS